MKQQNLSPEKYIQTKARSLPVYKCYVTKNWEELKMANVMVMRKHINGNCTVGFYLVDLLCLGIKDTHYFFNETEEKIYEKINPDTFFLEETDYNTAHNIVYAGHDFAMDFDIQPHKDFAVTKFILENDDDDIPLIEIPTGDENGNPYLLVNNSYNYGPVLQKLKKNAGDGNYTFIIGEDDEDFDDDPNEEEDEDWDKDDENDGQEIPLDEIEENLIDFNLLADYTTDEILEDVENGNRSGTDLIIIKAELLFRRLAETEPGSVPDYEDLMETDDYKLYNDAIDQNILAVEMNKKGQEYIYAEIKKIHAMNLPDAAMESQYLNLLEMNSFNELNAFIVVQSMSLNIVLQCFDEMQQKFHRYLPAPQMIIAGYAVIMRKKPYDLYHSIFNAQNAQEAYLASSGIYALHHKLFWLIKALLGIEQNDKEKIIYYHSLLEISGIGGGIKYLYAAQLSHWLATYLDIDGDSVMVADNGW